MFSILRTFLLIVKFKQVGILPRLCYGFLVFFNFEDGVLFNAAEKLAGHVLPLFFLGVNLKRISLVISLRIVDGIGPLREVLTRLRIVALRLIL